MHTLPAGLKTIVFGKGFRAPGCCRFRVLGSNSGWRGGGQKTRRGNSKISRTRRGHLWRASAGNDDPQGRDTNNGSKVIVLNLMEALLETLKGAIDNESIADDAKMIGRQYLKQPMTSEDIRRALDEVRRMRTRLEAGEEVDVFSFAADILDLSDDKRGAATISRIPGYILSVCALGWLWSLAGVDGWERFHLPSGGFPLWVSCTVPYVLSAALFWQKFFLPNSEVLKAYKLCLANFTEEKLSRRFLIDASNMSLALEACLLSFVQVFSVQGCLFGAVDSFVALPAPQSDVVEKGFGAVADQIVLPRGIRLLETAGVLSLMMSIGSILKDPSLLLGPAEIDYLENTVPVRQADTQEEALLLIDPEVVRDRRLITAGISFLQAVYLTSEMLVTNSLIAPMATHALCLFLYLKAVQDMRAQPQSMIS